MSKRLGVPAMQTFFNNLSSEKYHAQTVSVIFQQFLTSY